MTETVSEPLNNVVLPQQIMATDQVPTTTASGCVTTTIDSLPATSETLNSLRTENIAEEITTSVEPISNNETISVSTQVNILTGHQVETNEFSSQPILQSPTMTDKNIVQDSESVSLPTNAITMSAEGAIVSNAQGELIEILPVSSIPTISTLPTLNPNLPPWAARLRDCELIGDSYRGYVTNEVELDLILTLHKQHTNSCWGTRQSPSSAKPSIRLMWKSQYVPYDGIPFLNTGRRATVMECQYGPRRKGNVNKKSSDFDSQGNAIKKSHRPTCPARIYIKKVKKFPEYRIDLDLNLEGKNVRQAQERALTHLRLAGVETGGEERFYVQLPLPIAHEYHDVEDLNITQSPDSKGQRLNQQVADKIHEFVARGITGVYTIKHCLKEYVEKEMYTGQDPPPRHNKAFFPTIIDLQNHIHEAQAALLSGQLLPLPPFNNPPIVPSPTKERVRKRKHPTKHSQTSQTINRLQTAEAVASIQDLDDENSSEHNREDEKAENDHNLHEQLAQFSETEGQPLVIAHGQADPTKNGQVVIVVTSNNVFTTGQETDPPTSFAQISLPSSHIANIPSSSFGTLPTGSQAVLITQQGENGQYLAQAPHSNILTVMGNPTLQGLGPNQRVVLRMMATPGNIQAATAPDAQADPSAPEQLLASQAAVAAVLNAAATVEESPDQPGQDRINDGEPPHKRQAVGIDLSSLVKEAGFDSHHVQVSGVEMTTCESSTPHTTILTESTTNPQDYTNNGAGTTLVEYTYQNNTKEANDNTQDQSLGNQSLGDQSLGNQSLNNQSLVGQSIDDQSLGNQSLTGQSLDDQSLGNQSLAGQSLDDQSLAGQSLDDQSLGNQSLSDQQSVMETVDEYEVLDDNQATQHQATVDTREIHPIAMEAELIDNFPKFTSTSATLVHVTGDSNGTHVNSDMVLVTDNISSYQAHTNTSNQNNGDLNGKELNDAQ